MRSVDYIVVGQGLAGSCVALQLLKKNRSFIVISHPNHSRSSLVAAGLFNPVTGVNFTKTWLFDKLFPYLHGFYSDAESITGQKFFHPLPLYRPFTTIDEQNTWLSRTVDNDYDDIVERVVSSSSDPKLNDPLGGLWLKSSGYIRTATFLSAVRDLMIANKAYEEELFDYDGVSIGDDIVYRGIKAKKIIFCEGYRIEGNPWFHKVPVRPLKGETIDIKCDFKKDVIINRGVYMVPGKSNGQWRIGSTYNQKDKTAGVTAGAQTEMETKLRQLANFSFEVEAQDWGIRPTTSDRRPILGKHPEYPQMLVFNGLGTKGVTLAPYFSKVLIHWLENPADNLNKEVDVTRFKSLY
jgi:glycine oxidase